MNDQVDRTYYESTSWRAMRGCSNCAGYEPDDFGIGGVNRCKNGKQNCNGALCNCDAWAPDFEQGLMDSISALEAENAALKERIERMIKVAEIKFRTSMPMNEQAIEYGGKWQKLVAEWEAMKGGE